MTIEIRVPDIGIDEVEITEILVNVGDKVEAEQSIITVEGNKASIEIPAPFAILVKEIKVKVGDKVSTGSLVMISEKIDAISTDDLSQEEILNISAINEFETKHELIKNNSINVHATPTVRRLARELGIDLSKVRGTGRKGRILREDIQIYMKEITKLTEVPKINYIDESISLRKLPLWPKVDFTKFGEIEEIELSHIQKISGSNLSRNWTMIPHVTHFDKADITDLEIFRKQQNSEAEKYKLDIKITPIVFIIKAVAITLEKMPRFNSSLSDDGQRLILKKYINIGVAVDTQNGLVVPVFKNINRKGIIELSRELTTLFKKARDGKLTIDEMQGGCFTVSSIGNLGTTNFTPIVNAPEVAILGISKSRMESVWNGEIFTPRLMLPISLSFDHRVIDGADGARFITNISNILSDIRRLIM